MKKLNNNDFKPFIYPPSCYYGDGTPENINFNASIQELSQQIAYIGGLEASGEISSKKAYKKIRTLWKDFKKLKQKLRISKNVGNLVNYPTNLKAL